MDAEDQFFANEQRRAVEFLDKVVQRLAQYRGGVLPKDWVGHLLCDMSWTAAVRLQAVKLLIMQGYPRESAIVARSLIEFVISGAYLGTGDKGQRRERQGKVPKHDDEAAEQHAAKLAEPAVADDAADDRRAPCGTRVGAVDRCCVRIGHGQPAGGGRRGHVEHQERPHPVVAESLPHLDHEERGKSGRILGEESHRRSPLVCIGGAPGRGASSRDGVNAMRLSAASASRLRLVKPLRIAYLAAMGVRPILIHPDPRLRKVAEPVAAIDDGLRALASDMLETMYEAPGVGLAATQLGVMKRLFVMDCTAQDEPKQPMVLANPEILWTSEETVMSEEGCLSIPGLYVEIARPKEVLLRGWDLDGNEVQVEADELLARLFQHELDHLDGTLMVSHLTEEQRKAAKKHLLELRLNGPRPGPPISIAADGTVSD